MKFKKLALLSLLIPACQSYSLYSYQAIIWDVANTLIEVNTLTFFNDEIGVYSGITYTLFGGSPTKLKDKIFTSLNQLGAQTGATDCFVRDPEGTVLPMLLCDFLAGKADAKKTKDDAIAHLHKTHKKGQERTIMENITKAVFDPAKLAYHTKIISKGLAIVEDMGEKHGKQKLFILSNFNEETIRSLLKEKHMKPLADHFTGNNIFISGLMKELLPSKGCFEKLIKSRNLDPAQCVFITAMPYHAKAAQESGLKTVLVQNKDLKKAQVELKALGLI